MAKKITEQIWIKGEVFTKEGLWQDLDKLYVFVEKYYYLEILNNKIKNNFVIEDIENTALKYPENSLKVNLNYSNIW
jgi:hypothetical protein